MDEQRILELEIKLSFQEEHLQALNDVVIAMQKQVDGVELLCNRLQDKLDALLKMATEQSTNSSQTH